MPKWPRAAARKRLKRVYGIFDLPKRGYAYFLLIIVIICVVVRPYPAVAMWVAFALAGYSAIANDSIQTIGTFISSNKHVKWYYLWIHMGLIFFFTVLFSWHTYGGDISYERLQTSGLDVAPTQFSFLQLMAPVVLLALTRLRIPISTSILLLSAFSTKASSISSILIKSFLGYIIAFALGVFLWWAISWWVRRWRPLAKKKASFAWVILQWITSGCLWAVWIMQDISNIAVVLPRQLSFTQFIVIALYIVGGLGLLFYFRGDKIQRIVESKSLVKDVRSATLIDLSYAALLYYLKVLSTVPVSTTWVFIGLLGGRELGFSLWRGKKRVQRKAITLIAMDILYASIGLFVSMCIALGVNASLRASFFDLLGG